MANVKARLQSEAAVRFAPFARARTQSYVLTTDVASFFVYIDVDELERRLLAITEHTDVVRDLGTFLRGLQQLGVRGLPQGVPASSPLGNFYLNELDQTLVAAGVDYRRYMDDTWMFVASYSEARRLQDHVERVLYQLLDENCQDWVDDVIVTYVALGGIVRRPYGERWERQVLPIGRTVRRRRSEGNSPPRMSSPITTGVVWVRRPDGDVLVLGEAENGRLSFVRFIDEDLAPEALARAESLQPRGVQVVHDGPPAISGVPATLPPGVAVRASTAEAGAGLDQRGP